MRGGRLRRRWSQREVRLYGRAAYYCSVRTSNRKVIGSTLVPSIPVPLTQKKSSFSFIPAPSLKYTITFIALQNVERVRTYKLLGVIISDDLKWNTHVEYVITKAAKRLYALRLLKRAGVMPKDILKVYTCNIRSVLEYAAQVWQDIPAYRF